jgi:hypothetical protein
MTTSPAVRPTTVLARLATARQGDGSIDYVSHVMVDNGLGQMVVDSTDKLGGRVGVITDTANYAGNPFRDASNALVLRPSLDGPSTGDPRFFDGQDYIEGNSGNDILVGNQNQDDLVGGSSSMFSMTTPSLRPDGST